MDDAPAPARPAATVVLVRDALDGPEGIEVLMLHRDSRVAFGGMWVFPGGKVDPGDRRADDPDDEAPARRAAVREAAEETGLVVTTSELVPFAHWVPPPITPRRYATWFFLAVVGRGEVVVDGNEIRDHAWLSPAEALRRRDAGTIDLAPPTWVTLHDLADAGGAASALEVARARRPVPRYETRWAEVSDGAVAMWDGDAGYEAWDPAAPGRRHRLLMTAGGWSLERTS